MSQSTRQWFVSPRQLLSIVIGIIVLSFVLGLINAGYKYIVLVQRHRDLEQQRQSLVAQIDDLNGQIRYMQSDSFIEKAARSMLLWVRPGEKLIIPLDDKPSPPPTPASGRR